MREISEYTLLGNYLIFLGDKLGMDSIKYEQTKVFTDKILQKVNKSSENYQLLPLDEKMEIVKKMISKGVFRTSPGNTLKPFKQVYNYEVAKHIHAFYNCDGSLCFKFIKTQDNRDFLSSAIKQTYFTNLDLCLKNAVKDVLKEHELKNRIKIKAKN